MCGREEYLVGCSAEMPRSAGIRGRVVFSESRSVLTPDFVPVVGISEDGVNRTDASTRSDRWGNKVVARIGVVEEISDTTSCISV